MHILTWKDLLLLTPPPKKNQGAEYIQYDLGRKKYLYIYIYV